MAEYYVEPKLYTVFPAAPNNTTTAYDGDGLAKGAATPASVSLDLTSYTASAGDTFAIGGATLTGADNASPPANTFNTTGSPSGATLATRLASCINAATNLVTFGPTGWLKPQLRQVVYAYTSGATLIIRTWAGSAAYNSTDSFRCLSTGFAASDINQQFTGGTSGAWGYLFTDYDDGTVLPIAVARCAYGLFLTGVSNTDHGPIAGPCNSITLDSDIVHVRCNDKTFYTTSDNEVNTRGGTTKRTGYFLFDDGTEWPTGAGYLNFGTRVALSQATPYLGSEITTGASAAFVNRSADGTKGLRLITANAGRGGIKLGAHNGGTMLYDGMIARDEQGSIIYWNTGVSTSTITIRRHRHTCTRSAFYAVFGSYYSASYTGSRLLIEGCTLDFSAYSGGAGYVIDATSATTLNLNPAYIVMRDTTLIAASSAHLPINTWAYGHVLIENCRGMSQKTDFGLLGYTAGPATPIETSHMSILQQGIHSADHFRYENRAFIVDYDPTASPAYPSLNSYLPNGTAWSIRLTWSNSANIIRMGGSEVMRRSQWVTQANMNTVTVEMLFDSAITPTNAHFGLVVSYVKADGTTVVDRSHTSDLIRQAGNTTIPTSSESWTKPGSYSGWTARKLVLSLSNAVKQNTNIEVSVVMYKQNPSAGITTVFMNPEIGLTQV